MKTHFFPWITLAVIGLSGCKHTQEASSSLTSFSQASLIAQNQNNPFEEIDFLEENNPEPFNEIPSQGTQGLTYIQDILIVNKKYGLPQDYAPGVDPVAQEHVNALLQEMQNQGLDVGWTTSNFRSYEYQTQLYNNYVATYGQEAADTFSARPGFSEHQTGLAFDLTTSTGELITAPTEAQWLLDHAAEYGFIVRYQEGKEAITGYQAEPWHLRYIGERAQEIANSGLTLEEFLGAESGDYAA